MAPRQNPEVVEKVQPKLRMVANGSTEVNALRAEHAAAIAVRGKVGRTIPLLRGEGATPASKRRPSVKTGKLRTIPDAEVSVFVQLREDLPALGAKQGGGLSGLLNRRSHRPAQKGTNLLTLELSVAAALQLAGDPAVAGVELGQPLSFPTPTVTDGNGHVARPSSRRVASEKLHGFGEGVLIGLIDVGGFDFSHPDFLDGRGETRFERIWDQGGSTRPSPVSRASARSELKRGPFDYGSELRVKDLNAAIVESRRTGVAAHLLEPQSEMSEGSHATHVASIAAGNTGICPRARIAGVLITLPETDEERRRSFYDSTRIAHAVDYLLAIAAEKQLPISINISLGTNGHAHDDSSPVGRWIDTSLTRPGRSVCVAAGNAGQERPEREGDQGYVFGRVHTSGQVSARGLTSEFEWNVVGNAVTDLSENELEIWYGPQDRFAVQVKPPEEPWTQAVEPGKRIENRQLRDETFISVYNELYHPANGCNYIAVYLSPKLRRPTPIGVQAGQWLVRLIGREVRDGRFHGWIERDDPRRIGRVGDREGWVFPSFFSDRSYVDDSTVSSLACGQRIISVANLDEARRRISITSSQGPTRDGREKPDIAAPGTNIVAAKGFGADRGWIGMSGTSMASPFVAGTVGLMLAANHGLTGAQIGGIIKRTARPLPGNDFSWRNDSGSGELDPAGCVREAAGIADRRDVT